MNHIQKQAAQKKITVQIQEKTDKLMIYLVGNATKVQIPINLLGELHHFATTLISPILLKIQYVTMRVTTSGTNIKIEPLIMK